MRRSIAMFTGAAISLSLCSACEQTPQRPVDLVSRLFSGEAAEWIDMSHPYDSSTIFWPTARSFELEVVSAGMTEGGYYYSANNFCAAEHGGTHLDAPVHFHEGGHTTDQLPLGRLIGPAVVIDVSAAATANADYQVTVDDLARWEATHGPIPDGSILLLYTGWGARWPDAERYLGTALRGPEAVAQLHFPGLHPETAAWLVENREIDALGIDTPSIDYGQSTLFESHRILFAENVPAFENVAALERLPAQGAYVIALPMKIAAGSGGPLRVVGVIPR